MAGKTLTTSIIPSFLSIFALVPIILILIASINPNVLNDFFFMKTDTTNFRIPSTLSNSTILQDIGTVSGTDLVGQDVTASTLGLPKAYTVALFTGCAVFGNTNDITCSTPHVGFHLDLTTELAVDPSNKESTDSALSSYGPVSTFLGIGYILGFAFTVLALLLTIVTSCFPRAVVASAIFSTLATALLSAASIAAIVTYKKVNDAFNDLFSANGIVFSLGNKLFILGFVATAISLVTSIYLCVRALRRPKKQKQRRVVTLGPKNDPKFATGAIVPEGPVKTGSQGGLLQKIPFIGNQKYTQVQKQNGPAVNRAIENDNDWDPLVVHEEEEEYGAHGGRGITMHALTPEPEPRSEINTRYEPYVPQTDRI